MLRAAVAAKTPLGVKAKQAMDKVFFKKKIYMVPPTVFALHVIFFLANIFLFSG